MSPRLIFLAPAIALAGILAACGGSEERAISKVFESAPWPATETNEYLLTRAEDGESYGSCVLETKRGDSTGTTKLIGLCTDGNNRDDSTVQVQSDTLLPLSANRTVFNSEKDERYSFSTTYAPPIVKFVSDEAGKVRETERDLPEPDETSPDPGYYDDGSLLWLVRGIPFQEGWEGSFQDVNAGTGQTFRVDIKVEGQERAVVPLGEFQTWRVRIRTASVTNIYWIESGGAQRMIKARIRGIQDVEYELTKSE